MRFFLTSIISLFFFNSFSQEIDSLKKIIIADSLYREDQFYAGFNLNLMYNKPQGYSITKISPSFFAGCIRDMPINKSRTVALGLGLGATYNKLSHNLLVAKRETTIDYEITDVDFDKNKLEAITVDIPIEIRWRASNAESHRFLRIYSGVKLSFLAFSKSKYIDSSEQFKVIGNSDLSKISTTAYIAFGYNTWNLYAGYGITPMFNKTAKVNKGPTGLNPFKIGLIFYIL